MPSTEESFRSSFTESNFRSTLRGDTEDETVSKIIPELDRHNIGIWPLSYKDEKDARSTGLYTKPTDSRNDFLLIFLDHHPISEFVMDEPDMEEALRS